MTVSSVKLLANENFPAPSIRLLREAGLDVVSVREFMPAATDAEVLAFAPEDGRWILTFDRDYGELVFKHWLPPPPAIRYLRQEPYSPTQPAEIVLAALSAPDQIEGRLVTLSARGMRRKWFDARGN